MTWTDNAVGGIDTPKFLWHATSPAAWKSIKRQGLRARRPRVRFGAEPDGVYLHQRRDWAERHPDNGPAPLVLRVKVKGLSLVGVPAAGIYVHQGNIPPERIKKA